ncbi:hypothetical protein MGG_16081 [Pyricularia oryzae 70-15]|uniref:Uncharacterized protein n=1 Tax=Pyricularia oryzae (strain 70-15 / ATCC MYA-4617 / FGSC 8958) TaxID=242507 RepID=G4MQ29_PYRO7|nr:uncharacterized protein MGG_16081 [Pyricularia oryzae 70-15]EHA56422.1 hypothetical protein MGG_16081 [Pyricularia oryzae 70-15]
MITTHRKCCWSGVMVQRQGYPPNKVGKCLAYLQLSAHAPCNYDTQNTSEILPSDRMTLPVGIHSLLIISVLAVRNKRNLCHAKFNKSRQEEAQIGQVARTGPRPKSCTGARRCVGKDWITGDEQAPWPAVASQALGEGVHLQVHPPPPSPSIADPTLPLLSHDNARDSGPGLQQNQTGNSAIWAGENLATHADCVRLKISTVMLAALQDRRTVGYAEGPERCIESSNTASGGRAERPWFGKGQAEVDVTLTPAWGKRKGTVTADLQPILEEINGRPHLNGLVSQ